MTLASTPPELACEWPCQCCTAKLSTQREAGTRPVPNAKGYQEESRRFPFPRPTAPITFCDSRGDLAAPTHAHSTSIPRFALFPFLSLPGIGASVAFLMINGLDWGMLTGDDSSYSDGNVACKAR